MKVGFRERPYDLLSAAVMIAAFSALAIFGVGGALGIVAGILVVLFLPGYGVVAALFPEAGEINWIQRITLSIVVSLALVPLAGLLSNYLPGGIRLGTILAILDAVAIGAFGVAYVRRQRLPPARRLVLSVEIPTRPWARFTRAERFLVIVLVAVVVLASASLAYSATRFQSPPGFTELYLLNASGVPGGYPTNLTVDQGASVFIVVSNHEHGTRDYRIAVNLTNLSVVFDPRTGKNETIEVANATLDWLPLHLTDETEARVPYTFSIPKAGDYYVKFILFRDLAGSEPYRLVQLRIAVT